MPKENLDKPATKGEFHEFQGEFQELKGEFHEFQGEFQELKGEFHEFQKFISEKVAMKEDLKEYATKADIEESTKKILNSNDKLVKMLEEKRVERAATTGRLDRHERTLADHETRIRRVETITK